MTTVAFVEDEVLQRDFLVDFFTSRGNFDVVGEFGEGSSALRSLALLRPELVVIDLHSPNLPGCSLAADLIRINPLTKIVMLTDGTSLMMLRRLLKLGVCGILCKGLSAPNLLAICERVVEGALCLELSEELELNFALEGDFGQSKRAALRTIREIEVVEIVARGLSFKEAAAALSVKIRTVEKHRENLMRTVGAKDVYGLIRCAVEAKLAVQEGNFPE
jgi:DNA-binding NarL/FixJ family response regulator